MLASTPSRIAMFGTTIDELGEPVALVQLEQRAQVDVGLAGAGLHLDGEVHTVQRLAHLDAVALLHGAQVGERRRLERVVIGRDRIGDTQFGQPELVADCDVSENVEPCEGKISEEVDDARHRVALVVQRRVELELQRANVTPLGGRCRCPTAGSAPGLSAAR